MTCSSRPTAGPFGSGLVTMVAPVATGTVLLQCVEPPADNVPRRTKVPGAAPRASTRVAESGSSDSPKNHADVCPVRSAGLGPG